MQFTIIAYKSNGEDSCRGHVMERWGSDFSIRVASGLKDAINIMSEYFLANLKTARSQPDWEVTLLFNGVPGEQLERWEVEQRVRARAEKMAKVKHDTQVATMAAKAAAEKAAKDEAEQARVREQELKTLNRLKAKYETNQGETP